MSIVVLLSGGTALGADQVWTIEQLWSRGVRPAVVCGVSVGANNGVALAQGQPDRLRKRWLDIDGTRSFMSPNLEHLGRGLYDLDPQRKVLRDEVVAAPWACEYWVGVADYQEDRYRSIRVDTLDRADAVDAIIASSSQPVIMEWVEIGGHVCLDGGAFHVLPLVPKEWTDRVTEVHAIFASPLQRRNRKAKQKVNKVWEIASRSAEIWIDRVVRDDFERLQLLAASGVEVWVYAPDDAGRPFDASPETIRWRLDVVGREMWDHRRRL